jgi:hypothetical protein
MERCCLAQEGAGEGVGVGVGVGVGRRRRDVWCLFGCGAWVPTGTP